jgi:hypothetical protein
MRVCEQIMSSLGYVDEKSASQVQNLLICIEMLLASLAHYYIFPYYEWEDGYQERKEKQVQVRLADTLAMGDFYRDAAQLFVRKRKVAGNALDPQTPDSTHGMPLSTSSEHDTVGAMTALDEDDDEEEEDEDEENVGRRRMDRRNEGDAVDDNDDDVEMGRRFSKHIPSSSGSGSSGRRNNRDHSGSDDSTDHAHPHHHPQRRNEHMVLTSGPYASGGGSGTGVLSYGSVDNMDDDDNSAPASSSSTASAATLSPIHLVNNTSHNTRSVSASALLSAGPPIQPIPKPPSSRSSSASVSPATSQHGPPSSTTRQQQQPRVEPGSPSLIQFDTEDSRGGSSNGSNSNTDNVSK